MAASDRDATAVEAAAGRLRYDPPDLSDTSGTGKGRGVGCKAAATPIIATD